MPIRSEIIAINITDWIKGFRVMIVPLAESGTIEHRHFDDDGCAIFTVMRDSDNKPHLCRAIELRPL